MASITKNNSSNSFGFTSSKPSTTQSTCSICKRLLYSFEEILCCRVCQSSCHWRCMEPKRISQYGDNENYVCNKCADDQTTDSSEQITNDNIQLKPADSVNRNYRDFVTVPSKTNSADTNVVNTIRYFEEKQQQQQQQPQTSKITKLSELDRYLPSTTTGIEYHHHHHNGQDKNDSRTPPRIPQQQTEIESDDDENNTSSMFQANYQYTPLKEYAALRNHRTASDNNINDYQNSPSDHQPTSRYGGGLHYTNHGYDPAISRLVEPPQSGSTHVISPSNLSRHHNFISTTNLNINDKPPVRQQQPSLYSSQIRDNDPPIMKPLSQQNDYHSTVGNDIGVIKINTNTQQSNGVEKKLTDLVQQLGKQLETDAQKLNEKLELKLKNLENMIHQQTHIIQRQDEVIERLKSKILQIEQERDQYRDQSSGQESNETRDFTLNHNNQENITTQNSQLDRNYSSSSTTFADNSKISTKKTPAPRLDQQWSITTEENKPTLNRLVKNMPANRERLVSDSSSALSMTSKLASSVPIVEASAASSRLDSIIHQSDTKDSKNASSSNYSLAQVRHQDRSQIPEPVSMIQQQVITSVHHDDNDNDKNHVKSRRSTSTSSSSTSSSIKPVKTPHTITPNRNSNTHRSFESLQTPSTNDQPLKASNKTASLEFDTKPVQYDDPASIYITPVEASQPAIQANSIVKGWLRKQNRDSFLKRIERYYCILANNALLMHRSEDDRTPVKAINLKGAKVVYYDDAKHGPSLELSWSNQSNDPKHYHLYAPNPQEADQWVQGIQTTIKNLENKNPWQKYRLNI